MTIPVNKKLVDLFDLPLDESKNTETIIDLIPPEISTSTLETIEKIEQALPLVHGLESSDRELDEIAELAINSYRDLQDLGMQVDSRYSSDVLAVSATMLGHALTAKTAKITKKLKTIELQLKKAQLDQKINKEERGTAAIPLGEGRALDRNELLKMHIQKKQD